MIALLSNYKGEVPVFVHLDDGRTIQLNQKYWITISSELKAELERLYGPENVYVS